MMPFTQDTGTREDQRYCSYCYQNGQFTYEGDLAGFKKVCYKGMRSMGMNPITSWVLSQMTALAPRWKR